MKALQVKQKVAQARVVLLEKSRRVPEGQVRRSAGKVALMFPVHAMVLIVVLQLALGVMLEVALARFKGARGKRRRRGESMNVLRKNAGNLKSGKRGGTT